jgi:hypothetical protein
MIYFHIFMTVGAGENVFGKGWGRNKVFWGLVVLGSLGFVVVLGGLGQVTAYGVTAEGQKRDQQSKNE